MIEELQRNLSIEIEMVKEINRLFDRLQYASMEERPLLDGVLNSIKTRMRILNDTNASLVKQISVIQKLPGKDSSAGIERVSVGAQKDVAIVLQTKDKAKYLEELRITDSYISKLKKRKPTTNLHGREFKQASLYAQIANKMFLSTSKKLIDGEKLRSLDSDIKRSNLTILSTTYISTGIFTSLLAFILGIIIVGFLLAFTISSTSPYISQYTGSFFARFLRVFWIVFALPILTLGAFYIYPGMEQKSIARRIDAELPFVVIHMGSISGSGIEPSQIFKIIAVGREYKYTGGEIRKLLNQITIYGYDLLTALKNVARITPSTKFAELLNGLASAISSGGDLKTFFEKRSETLLLNYRLEREKFTKVAETFMDIYISLVIATPMILLLLLVMISVSGVSVGLSIGQMTLAIILIVAVINVIFLWLLSIKQPTY